MDVKAMVTQWIPIIRGLAVGHTKAEVDRCEFEMETHMVPLLTAPVKQLRVFYQQLTDALKADATIPMFVWTMFDVYGEHVVKPAKDEEVIELKATLAAEIARLVEAEIQPDLRDALTRALQWRSGEELEAVKAELTKGTKPRLKGRQSCLFLTVGDATVML